jgi:hypothetical protein
MLNKTSGTFSSSGAISSATENAITAMPTQTSRTKNLLPAFADILATSSETASWTGSESTPKAQVAAKPQSASGPGNRMASVASLSAERAAQASSTEQLVPAYVLPMNDWAMPNAEDPILTINAAPSETTITASSAPSSSLAGGEVSGPQTLNHPATTPTNVTPATLTALISSLPMSRRDASSVRGPGNGFLENTLPVAETSNQQPVTSAEFEPSPMGVFVSPSASSSSAPKVVSQSDLGSKAFAGGAQAAAPDSNATQSTPTNFAPLNPADISGQAISGTPTATLSSMQASQNIVEGPAPNRMSQQAVPAEISAGGDETDTLAEALGALLRRFSASSFTSTVISSVPSVVTTTTVPAAAQTDFVTTNSISASKPTKETAPIAAPVLASTNLAPAGSVDTPALDMTATILQLPDFARVAISYEQESERSQPATGLAVNSTPTAPDPEPTDIFAQTLLVTPILTPIVSQPVAQEATTTTATPLMTSSVRTSTAPSTLLEASSVLEAMVGQTVDAVLTQAPASAPHAPAYAAEQIVAPTMESAIPMGAAPFIAAMATSTSTAPQQKAPSQSFASNPKIETPAPATVTLLPQPTAPSVASPKIPFVVTPTAANPANSAPDNSAPFRESTMTAPMIPAQPAASNEKPVWGIATNATASGVPAAATPAPAAPAAFNQDSESQTDTASHSPSYSKTSTTESAAIATPAPASAGAAILTQVASIADTTPKLDAGSVATNVTIPSNNASSDAQLSTSVLAQRTGEGQELSAALQAWNGGDNAQTRLVQAAHLGGNLRESEMNISMQAESLGAVELRTRVSGDVVGAAIGVERHDAHVMISNNLSSLHEALQERQLRLGNVTVFQNPVHSGVTTGDGSASQQRGTAPRQSASAGSTGAQSGLSPTEAAATAESSEGNAVFDSNGRLSVRA